MQIDKAMNRITTKTKDIVYQVRETGRYDETEEKEIHALIKELYGF
jgi:hypothetical protein